MNDAVAAATPLMVMQGACAAVVTAYTGTGSLVVAVLVAAVAVAVTAVCAHAGRDHRQLEDA